MSRDIQYYNLDMIISVGYRVHSLRGVQFRMWATQMLIYDIVKMFNYTVPYKSNAITESIERLILHVFDSPSSRGEYDLRLWNHPYIFVKDDVMPDLVTKKTWLDDVICFFEEGRNTV